ncbi:MAG: metallophosphoesterase family protein [Nanoarchaeota archaeon]|nr:metallophosphoesterase family protein [Nanoarchaeota archaeon]
MSKKLKLLAASDLHGDSRLAKKLADRAEKEKVDLIVLCGDLLGWAETQNLIKPFKEKNKPVLIIPGNWDSFATTDFIASIYGVKNIHGYSAIYENVGFFGAGGAADSPGPGRISEKEIFETLKKAYGGIKGIEKKIMVTHMHPSPSLSEMSGVPGSETITKAIKQFKPDILIHGHIHEAGGMEEKIGKTQVINVGREGRIIEI